MFSPLGSTAVEIPCRQEQLPGASRVLHCQWRGPSWLHLPREHTPSCHAAGGGAWHRPALLELPGLLPQIAPVHAHHAHMTLTRERALVVLDCHALSEKLEITASSPVKAGEIVQAKQTSDKDV